MRHKIKNPPENQAGGALNAVWTRLELATSGVTGRHSNQLNYQTVFPIVLGDANVILSTKQTNIFLAFFT